MKISEEEFKENENAILKDIKNEKNLVKKEILKAGLCSLRKSFECSLCHKSKPDNHEKVKLQCSVLECDIDIDKNIAPLISELWLREVHTTNSCENNNGYVWIEFDDLMDIKDFLSFVFEGQKYGHNGDKLFNDSKLSWVYSTRIEDSNMVYDEVNGQDFIYNPFKRINPIMSISVRFPIDHYEEVYSRVKNNIIKTKKEIDEEMIISSLVIASRDNRLKEIKTILKNNPNLDINSSHYALYINALTISIKNNHQDVAKYLIEKGADINTVNIDGENALMIVAQDDEVNYEPVLKFLIENGINTKAKNKYGQSALDLAKEYLDEKDIKIFQKYKIN